jgi:hypothetical protein
MPWALFDEFESSDRGAADPIDYDALTPVDESRFRRSLGRRDVCHADEKFSCQCHLNSPFIVSSSARRRPSAQSARYALGKAAISSAVVRIWWAKVGPFSLCAACIISCEKAAVASRTRVT